MTHHAVIHDTFTIERTYPASPARVYAAFADPKAKALWFAGDDWTELVREMDFRVGGRERVRGQFASGVTSDFQCHYLDIVPERRIVYSYDMFVSDHKMSVSLATIEIIPDGTQARLVFTEQGAFFDGDPAHASDRQQGSAFLLDRVGATLATPY